MTFSVSREVLDLGLKIVAITIDDIDIKTQTKKFLNFQKTAYTALKKKYKNFDIETDLILRGFNNIHKKIGVKRRKHTPINELLLKMFLKSEKLPSENKLINLYNIVILDSRLPIFIYDKDKITGNLTLTISKKSESYISKNSETKITGPNEYICKDKKNIVQRLEIDQNPNTKVNDNTKNILIIIEGNENTSAEYLIEVASEIIDLINTYCGGKAQIIYN